MGSDGLVEGTEKVFYIPEFVSEQEELYLLQRISNAPDLKWKNLANRRLQVWGGEINTKNVLISQSLPSFVTEYPDLIARIRATNAFKESKHQQPNHILLNEYRPGQGIMPHEDGLAYYPTVATLSLGSHTVMHYYQYKPGSESEEQDSENPSAAPIEARMTATPSHSKARPINPTPVLSLLLEPRSLLITSSSLYTSHLHGIDSITEDVFPSPTSTSEAEGVRSENARRIANLSMLSKENKKIVTEGGTLERTTRTSLTFRDVHKVFVSKLK